MAGLPRVTVTYSNGNLLYDINSADGIVGMTATAFTNANAGKIYTVFSLKDAENQGITQLLEPSAYRHIAEFYGELGANGELWIMLVADTFNMANMLLSTDETMAIKLVKAANGRIRILGITHEPYSVSNGIDFLDSDTTNAVTASKTFGDTCLSLLMPLRILIEGKISDETSATIFQPKTALNGYAGIVLGSTQSDKSASVGLVLGRAAKYAAHIKIGKVANGPLSVSNIVIGNKALADMANLDAMHDKGYISFMTHPQKAGIYLGIDRMASDDDYRLLAYGRIVDKAAVIAAAVYITELESEVDVDADGKISELDLKHLEGRIEQQINVAMADQISGIVTYINPDQNIITTNTLIVKLRVRPKGYTSFIDVDLGLTSTGI